MGSWNNTCGLTNLPIIAGDAVYVFPILERDISDYRSHCETTAFYEPMLTPFTAEYNDYGGGENCEGLILEPFINELKSLLVELSLTEASASENPVDKDNFDIDTFFEAIHDDNLFVRGWRKKQAVYFTMVRKDVADRMWREWKFDVYVGEGNATNPTDVYERDVTYEKLAEHFLPQFIESLKKTAESTESLDKLDRQLTRQLALRDDNAVPVLRRLRTSFDRHEYWDILSVKEKVMDAVIACDYDHATELLKLQLLGIMISDMMNSTRRIWLPVMHQGSQSAEYDDYRLLHKIANDVMDQKDAEYRAMWGEDDNEDEKLVDAA